MDGCASVEASTWTLWTGIVHRPAHASTWTEYMDRHMHSSVSICRHDDRFSICRVMRRIGERGHAVIGEREER
jgi:hypothetical protein